MERYTKINILHVVSPEHRSYFMRTETFRVAPMNAPATALTCILTSAAATPLRWRAAAGCCMRRPTTLDTSTFWPRESIRTTSAGWATTTPSARVVLSLMWVYLYVNVIKSQSKQQILKLNIHIFHNVNVLYMCTCCVYNSENKWCCEM